MKSYAILLDTTLCTGCNTCLYKCIQENMRHDEASRGLFRTIAFIRDTGIYHQRCMHCVTPDCVDVCPEGALTKTDYGPVLYNADLCIGCQTCIDACPFSAPLFDQVTEKIVRCSMCAHRISEGQPPACVEACPTEAWYLMNPTGSWHWPKREPSGTICMSMGSHRTEAPVCHNDKNRSSGHRISIGGSKSGFNRTHIELDTAVGYRGCGRRNEAVQ